MAGRPPNREPSKYLGLRAPESVYNTLQKYADDHAEKLSQIVLEALRDYIDRVIVRRCPSCGTENPEENEWCRSCGAPLSREAEIKRRAEIEEMSKEAREKLGEARGVLENAGLRSDQTLAAGRELVTMIERMTVRYGKCAACQKCPDLPVEGVPAGRTIAEDQEPLPATIIPEEQT